MTHLMLPGKKGGRKEKETEMQREIKNTIDWGPSPKHISLSEGYFIADLNPELSTSLLCKSPGRVSTDRKL